MDEELGVKVTRLRRRLSIESEGVQSPATPSTPTKKRATRLAKPALDLIDENVTETAPKRVTRKSIARDVADPSEEKAVTPSRRSVRIRSNTSLIAESQPVSDSPRARRAVRRNSQLGSDTETVTTPAKATRRTRKDSTSSVENLAVANPSEKITVQVAEAIIEEPDKEIPKDTKVNKTDDQSPVLRKSPRLNKKGRKSLNDTVNIIQEKPVQQDKTLTDSAELSNTSPLNRPPQRISTNTDDDTANNVELEIPESNVEVQISEKINLSLNSANMISQIDIISPKKSSVFNKTDSGIEESKNKVKSRKRTKSWTSQPRKEVNLYDNINNKNSEDSYLKNSEKVDMKSPNKSASVFNSSIENKENVHYLESVNALDAKDTVKVLENTPSQDIQSMVFMEDSDSNSGNIGKLTMDIPNNLPSHEDDQCVPVVKQPTPKRSSPSESFSVEPMDIDETVPENVTINDFSDKSSSREEENIHSSSQFHSKRKSSITNENSITINDSSNNSKRTSICAQQDSNSKSNSSINSSENHNNSSQVDLIDPYNANKSKRKTSLSNIESNNKSATSQTEDKVECANKSKRQSLLFNNSEIENTKRKLSSSYHNASNDKPKESDNESKRKSSLSDTKTENAKRKSSNSSQAEDKPDIIVNISKNKSTSDAELPNLDSTSNENKSTLVLSQLRDMSSNEVSNTLKSPNDTKNELSKSVNIPDANKKTDKKNLSQNYLTSTPLQQKTLQKLAMQINTSIISANADGKNASKVNDSQKKNVSEVASDSDTSVGDGNEDSKSNCEMIEDEAEEANSDYESGDSRDEEEQEYEKEHELIEKGETLESEENISDDSDYEKDSFVVSSNEEDDDLLSGSGDDLSSSDNELNMSAKSKKKFDDRKRKEQKKASKEMYEARHKLNESDQSSKSKNKKLKHQHLRSSALESDKEDEVQPKKNNRLRIDSSQDVSINNSDDSLRVKKKKTKRLSESVCEENADAHEKEITIHNQSVTGENDPLSFKQEPKTPQKDFNISTVQINKSIEKVHVDDANASVMNEMRTADPLEATQVHEEESDSDISEDLEIQANYDSVLENLMKTNKQMKIKNRDTSFNLNEKKKNDAKEPIIDQLNITQTKTSKKNKAKVVKEDKKSEEPLKNNEVTSISPENDGDDASDTIDMRLLFSEDSNDSETNANKLKNSEIKNSEPADLFIPLKRTEAKTNIRESLDLNTSGNKSELNVSKKKNKNRKSENILEPTKSNDPEETNVSFFIDTKGTYEDVDTSTQNSAKKNKKKHKQNMSVDDQNESLTDIADKTTTESQAPLDVSSMSDKKKKKHKKNDSTTNEQEITLDVSRSGKKKHKKTSESVEERVSTENATADTSVTQLFSHEQSPKSDKKKKKNKHKDTSLYIEESSEATFGKEMSQNIEPKNLYPGNTSISEPQDNSYKSDKKKKKNKSLDTSNNIEEDSKAASVLQSEKKKSKKLSESAVDIETENAVAEFVTNDSTLTGSEKKKKNKNKKNKNLAQPESDADGVNAQEDMMGSKKRKRDKNSPPPNNDNEEIQVSSSQSKKRKVPQSVEDEDAPVEERISYIGEVRPCDIDENPKKKLKKNKKSKNKATTLQAQEVDQDRHPESYKNKPHKKKKPHKGEITEKPKKRKAAGDHDGQNRSKVFKENSFDDVHVPRLPESIINQLADEPPKQKKIKAISTVPFQVEEAKRRKNKPSNYLEQSIHLNNNESPVKKKQKTAIKNPKVLPFIPTAIVSGKGYTSNFRINLLPQDTQEFVAQASNVANFKNDYLSNQRIKKLGTFERFKKQRCHKISKF